MRYPRARTIIVILAVVALAAIAGTALAQDAPATTGFLNLTCGIKDVGPTDVVACTVTIDGAPQPDQAPGQVVGYPLAVGDHTLTVALSGAQASLWEPASVDKTVSITSTTVPKAFEAKFVKKAHLTLTFKQTGVTADLFIDGEAAGTQAASLDVLLSPNKNHKIEAKNIVDPAANGVYGWKDNTQYVFLKPGAEKALEVNLTKKPIKGFLKVKCALPSVQPTDVVICHPTLDDVVQPDILPGQEIIYTLDKGRHTILVELTGDAAHLWAPQSRQQKSSIFAGVTTTYKPVFTKSGHLIVNLDQPGVVGDFYLDGTLVGTQVAGFDAWVTPSASHKVEVQNLTDPNAKGLYYWKIALPTTASVSPGAEKTVTIKLTQVNTAGTLGVYCVVTNVPPPNMAFSCGVWVDDVRIGDVAPNTYGTFLLPAGDHTVKVTGAPENEWSGNPWIYPITINVNQTTSVTAYFNLTW